MITTLHHDVWAWVCVYHTREGASLGMESLAVLSHLSWVLETEPVRAVSLNR